MEFAGTTEADEVVGGRFGYRSTMSDKDVQLIPPPADPATPKTPVEFEKPEEHRKEESVANEAAERAGETEQRYDQDHGVFTK